MASFAGKAAALGKFSSMFKDVGQTASSLIDKAAAEKRRVAKEEKDKPFEDLKKRLLTTQVEGAELGTQEKTADIESDRQIDDLLNNFGIGDEGREALKTTPMKSNELLGMLKSAERNPQETIQEYASFLGADSQIGQEVRASLSPGQAEALDAMLSGKPGKTPEDAVKRMVPALDETTELGQQARATDVPDPILAPGEKAPEKPTTSSFRFEKKELSEPQKVTRAREILSQVESKRPTEKQKDLVKRNRAIIDKFEGRQEKKSDLAESRDFTVSLADAQRAHQEKLANQRLNAQKIQNTAKRNQALKDLDRTEKTEGAKFAQSLRKEIKADPLVKDFNIVNTKYRGMKSVMAEFMKNPDKKSRIAVDAAVITLYNKILDPGSVVRESEYARTQQGQALLNRLKSFDEKILQGGTGLAVEELQEILSISKVLRDASKGDYDNAINSYKENISDIPGVDPENVLRQFQIEDDDEKSDTTSEAGGLSTDEEDELKELEKRFGK